MSSRLASPSAEPCGLPAGLVVVRTLRGDAHQGCGQATTATGETLFVRWERKGLDSENSGPGEWTTPEREYRVLTSLPSMGVPRPIDLSRDAASCCSVTSWIEGETLNSSHRGALAEIADQLVAILARAHWSGWVHGDLKPANIVIGPTGVAQIVDWAGARRIGDDAPPGTLGYAPPSAWSASHTAQPRNDTYALAVTLWEIWTGSRAFSGDRAEILAAQAAFDFPLAGDPPLLLRSLTECARRGAEALPDAAASVQTRARGVRASSLARKVLRPEATSAARGAFRTSRGARVSPLRSIESRSAADVDDFAEAILDAARLDLGFNGLRWPDLVAQATGRAKIATAEAGLSRADELRNQRARVELEVSQLLALRFPVLVVATQDELTSGSRAIWDELQRVASEKAGDGRPSLAFLLVSAPTAGDHAATGAADRSREVVEDYLCASSISERVIALVGRRATGSVTEAIDCVRGLVESGAIEHAVGCIDLSKGYEPAAAEATKDAPLSRDPTANGLADRRSAPRSFDEVLTAGESAAAEGRLDDVVRACIRAQSTSPVGDEVTVEDVIRLADLWLECGRSDAAEATLKTVNASHMSAECALRLARVILNRGDTTSAEDALDRAEQSAKHHWHTAEVQRLRALVCVARRDFAGAYTLLRAQFRRRRELPTIAGLWLATTLGNVLRMRQRPNSSRRILRWVKQRASRSGSVRLQIAASTNLILARQDDVAPAQTATEAWTIAQRCLAWGMTTEGLMNASTAARAWVIAGDGPIAVQHIDRLLSSGQVMHVSPSSIVTTLRRMRTYAIDIEENWTDLKQMVTVETAKRGSIEELYSKVILDELGSNAPRLMIGRSGHRSTSREMRCVSAIVRIVGRKTVQTTRLQRALHQMVLAIDTGLPISSHAARMIVRQSSTADTVAKTLQVARTMAQEGDAPREFSIAIHASALAWTESVDAEALSWFSNNAPADERRRPRGIRLWEWRLATARVAVGVEAVALGGLDVEGVLVPLERTINQLWTEARATYNAVLPIGVLARIAGLDGQADDYREKNTDDTVTYNRIRGELYRHLLVHGGTGGRAAGLERVLGSALKLRSAVEVEALLGEIALGVIAICRAERAVVVYDAGRNEVRAKVATDRGVASMAPSDTEVSLTAVARVRESGHACIYDDACVDDDLGDRPSVMRFRPRSLIIAPLQTLGEYLGYVYVENRSVAKSFTDSDVELVEGFAAQAALALENAQLVTELRRSCEELERARKDAIRAESLRVLGRMASEVAHDFNNLLTAIIGETQLLMHEADSPDQAASLGVIERAALDGAEVIRRIQDTTRVKDYAAFDVVSINGVLNDVLDMIRWRATSANARVSVQMPPDLRVRGVASELREVFTNVVANAIDAMPDGGDLRIAGRLDGDEVVVEVEDTGCGMNAETMTKVFDPFFTTKGERGNGLGLSIAYGIVQRHGGKIAVKSEVGRGTRMTLSMPVFSSETDQVAPRDTNGTATAVEAAPSLPDSLRVLVVDDEPTVARILASMLTKIGAEAEVSIGGNAAIKRIARNHERFDVVITDVNMPDKNGIEVARELLAEAAGPRVIVMSGSLGGREEDTAKMLGVRVLRKPFTISDVHRVLFSDR